MFYTTVAITTYYDNKHMSQQRNLCLTQHRNIGGQVIIIVTVVVTDNGGLMAETELQVEISDVNDNAPVFSAAFFDVNFKESSPIGTLVFATRAEDVDYGQNSNIIYKIVSAVPIQAKYMFNIDRETGRIITTKHIQRRDFKRFLF